MVRTFASVAREQDENPRLLLVQCCHLPQFFYMAAALRRLFPDTPLDALVIQSGDLDFYLSRQNPFSSVLTPASPSFQETNYSRIFFPLLNRVYRSIKSSARRLSGPAFEVNYQGRSRPLNSGRLALSILYPLHQPDQAFREYFLSFPHHRPLAREPLRLGVDSRQVRPILVMQTEHSGMTRESIRRLASPKLYPGVRLVIVCRAEDSSPLKDLPGVERIVHYPRRLSGWFRLARQLRSTKPCLVSLILSGRSVFSLHKIFVLALFPFRPKLAFNAQLDAYWLRPTTVPRVFRREPLLLEEPGGQILNAVLLIQTDSSDATLRALEQLQRGQAVGPGKVRLLCREEDRQYFLSRLEERDISTWAPGISLGNLKQVIKVGLIATDVVTASFSGRPVFRLQKLAFFLLPARNRLVFNENLDCFYLTRSRLGSTLRLPSIPVSIQGASGGWKHLLRKTTKMVLWLPRFSYLLGWLSVETLRRARHLQKTGSTRLNQQP